MFSTERQQAMVCDTLCRVVGLRGRMWTPDGPTELACAAMKRLPGWSHGEVLMFKAAHDVWNGGGQMKLGEALGTLDGKNLQALGTLLVALGDMRGSIAIDEWLKRWRGADVEACA